jgi:hypothetical protein
MADKPATSFQLPEGKTIDVYLVKLANGKMVPRSRDELAIAPPPANDATAATINGDGQGRR